MWNPYLFLGHPTIADPLAQPFYPVSIGLGLVFGIARGLAIGFRLITVFLIIGGAGTQWLESLKPGVPTCFARGCFARTPAREFTDRVLVMWSRQRFLFRLKSNLS